MNNNDFYSSEYSQANSEDLTLKETNITFVKSFLWMFLGTFISFIVGLFFSKILFDIVSNQESGYFALFLVTFIIITIAEFFLVYRINKEALIKLNFKNALIGFIVYSILDGFVFSFIFAFVNVDMLYQIFGVVSLYFLLLAGLSYLFRNKIKSIAVFGYIGLACLVIVSIITIIFGFLFIRDTNTAVGLYIGILEFALVVFSILTIVDIRRMYEQIKYSTNKNAASISAAFCLYLDFMNIFLYVLRIVMMFAGSRRK